MGKFDGVLICTDLDGTLLKKDKTVSEENKAAIEYFKREGGYFTFVTGRMPYYVGEAYKSANPNAPFGCINGGGLYDYEKKQYICKTQIDKSVMELVRCVDEQLPEVGIQVSCFERAYFAKDNKVMEEFRRLTGVPYVACHYDEVEAQVGKILFGAHNEEEMHALEKTLRAHPLADGFTLIRSERSLFEILPKGVNKGNAIAALTDHLHLDPEKTIAVGDYNNDVPMLLAAKAGIAVANACPEALAAADYVTVSNEEHAIAQVICDIEKGMYI